ncbi:type II secretion system F family protein [Desertimonas flava]|jgi:tight adherence protein C|uniref:type II secretion system F family protein n=1 Tax=Desertimonas flava TaxID=2064846 RepID=UPI000E34522E|nr:type II secretion system F family protein [Desertimonas flava]
MTPSAWATIATVAAVVTAGTALQRPPGRSRPVPGRLDTASGDAAAEVAAPPPDAAADRRRHRVVAVASFATAGVVAIAAGPVLVVVGAVVAIVFRSLRRRRAAAADRAAVEASMPDAIELLVACLQSGRSPTQALSDLARLAPRPVRPAFAAVEQRLHRGHGTGEALGELITRCGSSALALVNAMSAALRDGLPLAPVLDRLTDEASAGRRRQGEAAARRLPVRLSFPLVACTLPSFVLLSVAPAILGALSSLRDSPL